MNPQSCEQEILRNAGSNGEKRGAKVLVDDYTDVKWDCCALISVQRGSLWTVE